MLVLSRKIDQQLVISENIVITILAISKDKIKIGIDAPIDVPIVRTELLEKSGDREGRRNEQ